MAPTSYEANIALTHMNTEGQEEDSGYMLSVMGFTLLMFYVVKKCQSQHSKHSFHRLYMISNLHKIQPGAMMHSKVNLAIYIRIYNEFQFNKNRVQSMCT